MQAASSATGISDVPPVAIHTLPNNSCLFSLYITMFAISMYSASGTSIFTASAISFEARVHIAALPLSFIRLNISAA